MRSVRAAREPYGAPADMIMPPLFVALTDQQGFNELRTTLNEYVREATARFVTGDLDPQADWDAYLAELDKIGIDRYLELVQSNLRPRLPVGGREAPCEPSRHARGGDSMALPVPAERIGAGGRDSALQVHLRAGLEYAQGPPGARRHGAEPRSDIDLATRGILDRHRLGRLSLDLDETAIPQECGVQAYEQIHYAPLKTHIDRWGIPIYQRGRGAIET